MAAPKKANRRRAEKRVDLVLEGGGTKGPALVGALAYLLGQGYQPQNIAGTSVGAIVGALLAAGYTPDELCDIMLDQLDFRRFEDVTLEGMLPLVGQPLDVLLHLGMYKGDALESQMGKWLAVKKVRTFKDLLCEDVTAETEERYRYKLQVITSDLTGRRMLVLPRDARVLGIEPDDLGVARAVRMSISVPIFFEPVEVKDRTGKRHVLVDGGLLSNYPVWIFDSEGAPAWPTFGLHLVNAFEVTGLTTHIPPIETAYGLPIVQLASFVKAMAVTALEAHDSQYIEEHNFARTIPIPDIGVGLLDFNIGRDKKQELYQAGYDAAAEFLARWDFEGYIRAYRSGKELSRRAHIAEKIKGNGLR